MADRKSVTLEKAEGGFIVRMTTSSDKPGGYQERTSVAKSDREAMRTASAFLGGKKPTRKKATRRR